MKLITLNQFVLDQYQEYRNDTITAEQYANRVKNYAKFLNTPITATTLKGDNKLVSGYTESTLPKESWSSQSPYFTPIKENTTDIDINVNGWPSLMFLDDDWNISSLIPKVYDFDITLTPNATKLFL